MRFSLLRVWCVLLRGGNSGAEPAPRRGGGRAAERGGEHTRHRQQRTAAHTAQSVQHSQTRLAVRSSPRRHDGDHTDAATATRQQPRSQTTPAVTAATIDCREVRMSRQERRGARGAAPRPVRRGCRVESPSPVIGVMQHRVDEDERHYECVRANRQAEWQKERTGARAERPLISSCAVSSGSTQIQSTQPMSARNNQTGDGKKAHVHNAQCKHEHEHEAEAATAAEQKHSEATSASASHSHSHSHAGSAKGQPCDYCSSVVAHARVQKLADREAKRDAAAKAAANNTTRSASTSAAAASCDTDSEEEEEEEDEEDKLILPAQRITLPLISPALRQALLGLFVLGALQVVRNIARAVMDERRARGSAAL